MGIFERFCGPKWTRYCNLQRMSTPMEAKQGCCFQENTTCTAVTLPTRGSLSCGPLPGSWKPHAETPRKCLRWGFSVRESSKLCFNKV